MEWVPALGGFKNLGGGAMIDGAIRALGASVAFAMLAGCSTYGKGLKETLMQVEQGQYQQADESVQASLDPTGDDRLLHHLERGTIQHLAGNHQSSNEHFEKAHALADTFQSSSAGDAVAVAMFNPRASTYRGADFERVYINYYKALNYLMLAQEAEDGGSRAGHLESARVELRRLDNKLSSISFDKGNYKDVRDKEDDTFYKLLDLFKKFQGNWLDEDWLVFREDAYSRYLAGVLYEKSGLLDDARIAYQKAAELYEQGYIKQYRLNPGMAEQAWLDSIRVMQRAGGYEGEWQRLAEQKLSPDSRATLDSLGPETAHLVVIQHLGMIPQRKEMNLRLQALPPTRSLRLTPVITGTEPSEATDQFTWFTLLYLYGDRSLFDMLDGFANGDLGRMVRAATSKTVALGPAWSLAEELRVPQALGSEGIRVTVPYYSPLRTAAGDSYLMVGGVTRGGLRDGAALAQVAVQEQLLNSSRDLYRSLARATLKNVSAAEGGGLLASALGGGEGLARLAAKLIAASTSAAETRNWLTLPYHIRIARIPVQPGTHQVAVTTLTRHGDEMARTQRSVTLEAGEIHVWRLRTMDPTQHRPGRPAGLEAAAN